MTSDISVGTAVTSGSRTILSGTISGLDTASLIQNAVDSNNASADRLDVRINENQTEIDAYQEFFGLANNVQTALNTLKSSTSVASDSTSVFDQRTANLTSTGAEATGLLDISINEGAPQGTYQIVVNQKAEAFSTSSTSTSDKDAAMGLVGNFDIGLDGFTATTIDITATDSLQDLADAINADTENSGVSASILQVSETDFQIIITGTQTNTAMSVTTNNGNVLQNMGIVDVGDVFEVGQIIQNEQEAQITFDGTPITRDDNTFDDLITGIEFDIRASDPASTITIDVNNDVASAKTEIESFLESFNALRDFIIQNQQVNTDGTIPEEAVLFGDNLLGTLSNSIFNIINTFRSNNGNVTTFADLGIGFDDNNRLILENPTTLDDALLNDFTDIQNFFRTEFTIDDSNLGVIANTSTQESIELELDIVMNLDGSIASASGGGTAFIINGTSITAPSGSIYEGITFAYVGDNDATISISMQAGIADRLNNAIEGYTNPTTGLIQNEIDTITSTNEDLTEEAEEIRTRGEEIREREISRYSDLEAALARAESLRRTLTALLGLDNDN
ncbi:MAG: flagellar filament capping protein FliD [Alphaproteobacteria bacterium]